MNLDWDHLQLQLSVSSLSFLFCSISCISCRRTFVSLQMVTANTQFRTVCYHPKEYHFLSSGTDRKVRCGVVNQKYIFFLLPVELFINVNCFGVSCLVLEISTVEISAFSLI